MFAKVFAVVSYLIELIYDLVMTIGEWWLPVWGVVMTGWIVIWILRLVFHPGVWLIKSLVKEYRKDV
jgi:hypothetical protein